MSKRLRELTVAATLLSSLLMVGGCNRGQSVEQLIADAKQYQQKGDFKSAMIQAKNAVNKAPENAEARLLLANMHAEAGDFLSAEKEFRKALSLGMSKDQVRIPLGKTMIALGEFQPLLDETKDVATKDAAVITLRGQAWMGLNDLAKAKEAFEQALKMDPSYVDAIIAQARLALANNDVPTAMKLADEAIAKKPSDADALFFKAAVLHATGKSDEALAAFDKVLAANPSHRTAHIEKAAIEIAAKKFDAAKADLDAARKISANSLQLMYTQALLDFSQAKPAAALESLTKILRVAPDHMPSLLMAGSAELQTGAYEQASQHLRKYIEKFPNLIYPRKQLANALLAKGEAQDALAALTPVLKDGEKDAELLALAGQASMQVRDFKHATEYFNKAAAIAPEAASLHTSLGLAKLGQGDSSGGVQELERATALNGKSSVAGLTLVRAELGLKQYDKALASVAKLEKELPNDGVLQNLKGGAYLGKKDLANARAAFEKAVQLQPTYFPAVTNLAQLDVNDKKPEEAKKRYLAFLDKVKNSADAMNALATLAAAQGQEQEATQWLEKSVAANPDAVGPAVALAARYLKIREPQKALTVVSKLQAANPSNAELMDVLGQTQIANGDATGALDSFSKLAGLRPKSPVAQLRVAGAHILLKNDAAAMEDIKKALALDPNFLDAYMAQVEIAMRGKHYEDGLAAAKAMQKQHANSAVGFAVEGDVWMAQKKADHALPAYEKAYEFAKTPEMLTKINATLRMLGKNKEADARLAQWQKDHPNDALVPMINADALLANKQYKEAIAVLEGVAKQQPRNVPALNNLAYAYQQVKDARALPTAEQAYKLAGENPAVNDTLGWMLVEQGDLKRGLPMLQKARQMAPQLADVRYHLAVGLSKAGDKVTAKRELEQLIAANPQFPQLDDAKALLKTL